MPSVTPALRTNAGAKVLKQSCYLYHLNLV